MDSLLFVKQRMEDGFITFSHNVSKDASLTELIFDEYFSPIKECNPISCMVSGTYDNEDINSVHGSIGVNIKYDPVGDFEYTTMESCLCDGTLYFLQELIDNIIQKLITCGTYNKEKMPDDYLVNPFAYDVFYTVGDFVVIKELGDFGTTEKPWLSERIAVLLPIKCELKKNCNKCDVSKGE